MCWNLKSDQPWIPEEYRSGCCSNVFIFYGVDDNIVYCTSIFGFGDTVSGVGG